MTSRHFVSRICFRAAGLTVAIVWVVALYGLHAQRQICLEVTTLSTPINLINPADIVLTRGRETNCTNGVLSSLRIPICTYNDSDDMHVSRGIRPNGYRRTDLVVTTLSWLAKLQANTMTSQLSSDSADDVILVDIGANLGTFTLAAAHSGFHVVAVEANWKTIRHLATSIVLGNVVDQVTLVHNAVSNTTGSNVHLGVDLINRGHAWIIPSLELCRQQPPPVGCPGDEVTTDEYNVTTVTLDDLVPVVEKTGKRTQERLRRVILKIDVEGSELQIFDRQTASRFLTQVDVVAAVVEWMWLKEQPNTSIAIDQLVKLFVEERDYRVMNTEGSPLQDITNIHWSAWPIDVCFIKRRYVELIDGYNSYRLA